MTPASESTSEAFPLTPQPEEWGTQMYPVYPGHEDD